MIRRALQRAVRLRFRDAAGLVPAAFFICGTSFGQSPSSRLIEAARPASTAGPPAASADQGLTAIDRGIAFLLKDQNPDGSWGGARGAVYTFTGDVWSNPETHRTWKLATTGLSVAGLIRQPGRPQTLPAIERGLDYILGSAEIKRPNEWDTMNNWAYIYGLQAVAAAYADARFADPARRERMTVAAAAFVRRLRENQSLTGGWGYLEFDAPRTAQPQWATSFTTAAGVIALVDARKAGLPIDEAMLARAVRGVARCRLPSGAYTYSIQAVADPRHGEWIDQVKGSLGRMQVCNLALRLAGEEVPDSRITNDLDELFRHHHFLDIARNRPIPHETYYYNSGYFYLFGHYYAARLIALLPPDVQQRYWPRLRHEIVKLQQADGSMYDYDMHAYHKPYGAAFGVLGLAPAVEGQSR